MRGGLTPRPVVEVLDDQELPSPLISTWSGRGVLVARSERRQARVVKVFHVEWPPKPEGDLMPRMLLVRLFCTSGIIIIRFPYRQRPSSSSEWPDASAGWWQRA